MGQRITGMTSGQKTFPCVAPMFEFKQHGQSGAWVSNLLPYTAQVVDDIAIVKSLNTEAINHDPATTYIMTGHQQPGRPSLGAWLSYGLGSDNQNLPAFVVMISQGSGNKADQPIFSRLWGSGFLPSQHQGVRLRSGSDPVLYLSDPPGIDRGSRRAMLDGLGDLNRMAAEAFGDPEINTRIAQYEMAFRMQASVPDLTDLSGESKQTLAMYGLDETGNHPTDGGYARNCLLARRMAERGVRFIELIDTGSNNNWDSHADMSAHGPLARNVDKPIAGLLRDLKSRGMLDETLVVWTTEFGRTPTIDGRNGRSHYNPAFSSWLAGGGVKGGIVHGRTDEYGAKILESPVHVHDFHATILHLLGFDHTKLVFRHAGRDFRLTDVSGEVVEDILV